MAERKGKLFVLSGFSGAGKGTVMRELLSSHEGFALSVSATSRAMREGEVHGVHYFFVTRERFEEMIDGGELIEHTEYQGNYYGTPKAFLLEKLAEGTDVFLEIEVDGGSQIRRIFPDAVLIFLTTPSAAVLKERLTARGTNTEEEIRGRLRRAAEETRFIGDYDYLLINDDLHECVETLYGITRAEHMKTSERNDYSESFRRELSEIL